MDETNWLQVGDVLDNFLLLEGTCEDLNALHEPLFLDVVVDTINPPDGSTETSLLQVESSPSSDVSDGKLLPFPCVKCPKSFQFRSRLQRHMTTHQVQIPEHCTEVRFASFLSGGFTTMAVINPPERKLAKRTPGHWFIFWKFHKINDVLFIEIESYT